MFRTSSPLLAALLLAFTALPSGGQTFQPKAIRFVGAAEYPDQDILNALQIAPGAGLTYAEMNKYAQNLVDTGIFSSVSFKFDGTDLIFQVTPASGLLPLRLHNLPFADGKDLEAKLQRQIPLYHGVLPLQGGLTESVRRTLEQMLASQKIQATVAASPLNDPLAHRVVAVSFSIVSPPVFVGDIRTEGAIVALDPKASAILSKFPGTPYDTESSLGQIEADFIDYYKDQGYADPAVHASLGAKPVMTPTAIRVPIHVSIAPGVQYKLGRIELAQGLLVSQAEFDRQFHFRTGDVADGERLREAWKFMDQTYRNHGYIKAKLQPAASFDQANKTVSYLVSVDSGPIYMMGGLSIDNVTDDLRSAMLAAWTMPAGSVFDESAISTFFSSNGPNPALARAFSGAGYRYTLQPHDDARTVDVKLTLEKKP